MRAYFQTTTAALIGLGLIVTTLASSGCKGRQFAHVLKDHDNDIVGTHSAGAETFNPLVEEAVGTLLAKQAAMQTTTQTTMQPAFEIDGQMDGGLPAGWGAPSRVCFVGIENRSAEELGDFYDQLYQQVDSLLSDSPNVSQISGRFVDAGLDEIRLRPEELFIPENMRQFSTVMEKNGQPFDCLIFGTLTSGTTESNKDFQRDYLLTLEMVDIRTGQHTKQSARVRKGYHKSRLSAAAKYNPFRR